MTGAQEHTCPRCHQRILIRCGTKLSPKLADLFDVIERSGARGGIHRETLAWMFYGGKSKRAAQCAVSVSISHINGLLAATDFKIQMDARFGRYRLVRS